MKRLFFNNSSSLLLIILLIFTMTKIVLADQKLLLDEIDPAQNRFGVFNSFEHKLLVVSITHKNTPPFDCQVNRYIFYDYGNENYYEIHGGNLKINSNYTKLIYTKVHSLESVPAKDNPDWKENIRHLVNVLSISPLTLESGKSTSTDGSRICWQQPELIEIPSRKKTPFRYLSANDCQYAWCSDLYWSDLDHVQFWIQLKPKEHNLISLNTVTGVHEFKDKKSKSYRKSHVQLNAPRENLVTEKNLNDGSFSINSQVGSTKKLQWKSQPNGRILIQLVRDNENREAANKVREQIVELRSNKRSMEAYQILKFGFWLSPDDRQLKMERLRVFASLMQIDNLLNSLERDFNKEDRFTTCQDLHVDPIIINLWKQKRFKDSFNKLCL
ncbi:hypothetical protein KJ966_15415 [bacterium]|nr:hypothetical protein [bacterium]